MVTDDTSITHNHHSLPTYCCPCCPSRDAVDMVNVLYNQVDEEVHKLVILSNKSLKQLESLLEVRRFEEQTEQIKVWFSVEGEKHLTALDSLPLSLATVKDMRQSLEQFFEESVVSLNIVNFILTCCFLL
uniref:Uncharacterized protein n=1 Tax=Hucho hucho TaxID=62062 RepID=A0A4W5LS97_9TELE